MRSKLFIFAGVIFFGVILFLIIGFGGSFSSTNDVDEEETIANITDITCTDITENIYNIKYETLTNNIQFDGEIDYANYNKIQIEINNTFTSFGVAFIGKSQEDTTLNITLYKNDTVLNQTTIIAVESKTFSANLMCDFTFELTTEDSYFMTIDSSSKFTFDSLLIFTSEV